MLRVNFMNPVQRVLASAGALATTAAAKKAYEEHEQKSEARYKESTERQDRKIAEKERHNLAAEKLAGEKEKRLAAEGEQKLKIAETAAEAKVTQAEAAKIRAGGFVQQSENTKKKLDLIEQNLSAENKRLKAQKNAAEDLLAKMQDQANAREAREKRERLENKPDRKIADQEDPD